MTKTTEAPVERFMESLTPVTENTEITEVINTMKNERTTLLPVVDRHEKLIGCVFDYNLIKLVRMESVPLAGNIWKDSVEKTDGKRKAVEIMDTRIVTILHDDTIDSALKVMNSNDARVLIVVDRDGKFMGVLRLRTIFDKLLRENR